MEKRKENMEHISFFQILFESLLIYYYFYTCFPCIVESIIILHTELQFTGSELVFALFFETEEKWKKKHISIEHSTANVHHSVKHLFSIQRVERVAYIRP